MKRLRLYVTAVVLTGLALAGAGWAGAQTSAPTPVKAHDAHHEAAPAKAAPGGMGAMGGGMGAMMGMGGADTQVVVKNTDKGVTITLTASDPAKVGRLQKMAEAVRLMHEATAM